MSFSSGVNRFQKKKGTRAELSYPDVASFEHEMTDKLCQMIAEESENDGRGLYPKVLLFGCNTGWLSEGLKAKLSWNNLDVIPLEPECRRFQTKSKFRSYFSFPESIPERFSPADLIVSANTFQSIAGLEPLIEHLSHALLPHGLMAFSLFLEENLREVWDVTGREVSHHPRAEIEHLLTDNGLVPKRILDHQITLHFPSPQAVLDHLRGGSRSVATNGFWTGGDYRNFLSAYEKFRLPDGSVSLTYHPAYFLVAHE